MQRALTILLVALTLLDATKAAMCHGKPDPNAQPNMNPIVEGTPKFVRSVKNAALYTVGQGDDMINVVHLWGSAYERGYAHGSLMGKDMSDCLNATWGYFEEQVIAAINGTGHSLGFPQSVIDWAADVGLAAALDVTWLATRNFTKPQFFEELQGMADASGLDYEMARRIHMIGELTKGSCSMYGAWGEATKTLGGHLLQLRALDWAIDAPLKNYPQITVYHSNGTEDQGQTWANIGWTGWIGSITGVSEQQMGISEIGVAFPDSTFGKESRVGTPFTNLLRNMLQYHDTIDSVLDYVTNANRTCDLILGIGDGKAASGDGFRGIQYSYSVANYYTDTDLHPVASWHPQIENVVYYGMDWLCPNFNSVLAKQLNKFHGNITAENSIREITPIVQTGDLITALYDLTSSEIWVANARGEGESGPENAYDRQFIHLNTKDLWSVKRPSAQ